jgi:hypothetical protein
MPEVSIHCDGGLALCRRARRIGGDHLNNRESLKTWAGVAVLLIFAGLASAVVPWLFDQAQADSASTEAVTREPMETTIDVGQLPFIGEVLVDIPFIADNIQGQPITMLQAFGIAIGAVLVGVGAVGLPIAGLVMFFDRFVNRVYADEAYQKSAAELQQREKERVSVMRKEKPTRAASGEQARSGWSMGVYGFIFLLLVWIGGLILSNVYLADSQVDILGLTFSGGFVLNLVLGLFTLAILYLELRHRSLEELENPDSDDKPVNWGYIWLVVSGLLIVGLGAGAALAVRGG